MSYFKYHYDTFYRYDLGKNGWCISDIRYGDLSEKNKLDLYLPSIKKEKYPVIVYVHGGGLVKGDKTHHVGGMLQGLQRGYAVACINYRLAEEAPYPACLQDVCEGIRFLKAHAADFHLDSSRFALWGDTHGGYLASRIAIDGNKGLADDFPTKYPEENLQVVGTVSFYAPMNLSGYYEKQITDGPVYRMEDGTVTDELAYGKSGKELIAYLKPLNPIPRIDGSEAPFYLLHGRKDFNIDQRNTQIFADALQKHGVPFILNFVENGIHAIDFYEDEQYNEPIMRFLDAVFAGNPIDR